MAEQQQGQPQTLPADYFDKLGASAQPQTQSQAQPSQLTSSDNGDSGPAQFNRSATKYPTMTKVDNGIAYDKTGKALGPYDESVQPSQSSEPQQKPSSRLQPQTLPADYFDAKESK